jgi:Flp pilus assembly protein TadG
MMRGFLADRRGNFALMTVVAMVPLMGGLAFAIDFAEMTREKQAVGNALDAAGIATARELASGAKEADLLAYAKTFFEANLGSVNPADTQLSVVLPANQVGGGTLKLSAQLNYKPIFFPVFARLAGAPEAAVNADVTFETKSEIRLKNTLEVALVLDNSGSMDNSTASGQKRIDLLKAAAKELVKTLADQAKLIKQVEKPVQFSLVPFAASVNVGPDNAGADWMDVNGVSPVHQENFDWTTLNAANKSAEKRGGIWYTKGTGWGAEEGQMLTR